jgi:hypothetical protein
MKIGPRLGYCNRAECFYIAVLTDALYGGGTDVM